MRHPSGRRRPGGRRCGSSGRRRAAPRRLSGSPTSWGGCGPRRRPRRGPCRARGPASTGPACVGVEVGVTPAYPSRKAAARRRHPVASRAVGLCRARPSRRRSRSERSMPGDVAQGEVGPRPARQRAQRLALEVEQRPSRARGCGAPGPGGSRRGSAAGRATRGRAEVVERRGDDALVGRQRGHLGDRGVVARRASPRRARGCVVASAGSVPSAAARLTWIWAVASPSSRAGLAEVRLRRWPPERHAPRVLDSREELLREGQVAANPSPDVRVRPTAPVDVADDVRDLRRTPPR